MLELPGHATFAVNKATNPAFSVSVMAEQVGRLVVLDPTRAAVAVHYLVVGTL
jgi:hypothetical protein